MARKQRLISVASRGGVGWYTVIDGAGGALVERTLPELQSRAAKIAEERGVELHFEVELPGRAYNAVVEARHATAAADEAGDLAQYRLSTAVAELVLAGLSTREAEFVLGMNKMPTSHSRVATLFESLREQRIRAYREALEMEPAGPRREQFKEGLRAWMKPPEQMRANIERLLDFADPRARPV